MAASDVTIRKNAIVVFLQDSSDSAALSQATLSLFDRPEHQRRSIVLDFSRIDFLSSAALGKLMSLDRRLSAYGDRVILCSIRPEIREVFAITKLDKLFTVVDSLEEALSLVPDTDNQASEPARELADPAEHDYLLDFLYPPDPDRPLNRVFPVRIFLSDAAEANAREVEKEVRSLCQDAGFEIAEEFPAVEGSWFKKLIGRSKDAIVGEEFLHRLELVERAAKLKYIEEPQARADQPRLEGAADLIDKIGDNNAVVQIGSVLLIRKCSNDGPGTILVRTLNQRELIMLEKNPALFRDPDGILDSLD